VSDKINAAAILNTKGHVLERISPRKLESKIFFISNDSLSSDGSVLCNRVADEIEHTGAFRQYIMGVHCTCVVANLRLLWLFCALIANFMTHLRQPRAKKFASYVTGVQCTAKIASNETARSNVHAVRGIVYKLDSCIKLQLWEHFYSIPFHFILNGCICMMNWKM